VDEAWKENTGDRTTWQVSGKSSVRVVTAYDYKIEDEREQLRDLRLDMPRRRCPSLL
jgi:hypothetical protein